MCVCGHFHTYTSDTDRQHTADTNRHFQTLADANGHQQIATKRRTQTPNLPCAGNTVLEKNTPKQISQMDAQRLIAILDSHELVQM